MKSIYIQLIFSILLLINNISCNLSFLSEETNKETNSLPESSYISNKIQNQTALNPLENYNQNLKLHIDPKHIKEYEQILMGTIEGFSVFKGATSGNYCIFYYKFIDQLIFLTEKIKHLHANGTELRKKLIEIVDEVVKNKETYILEYKECGKLYEKMEPGFDKMREFLMQKSYYDKFTMNFIGSLRKISEKFDEMKKLREKKKFNILGNKIAELITLVFFWGL